MNEAQQETGTGSVKEVTRSNVGDNQAPDEEVKSSITFGEKRAKLHRWTPRRWEEKYTQIVMLATLGLKTNKEIAEQYNYTPQQISNILNTPQAEELRKKIHAQVQKDVSAELPIRLERLATISLKNIEEVISSDKLLEAKPFEMFDRSMKVLHGVGKIKGEGGDRNINAIIFNSGDAADLRAAMLKADEAKRLHAPKQDNPFEIIQRKDGTDG